MIRISEIHKSFNVKANKILMILTHAIRVRQRIYIVFLIIIFISSCNSYSNKRDFVKLNINSLKNAQKIFFNNSDIIILHDYSKNELTQYQLIIYDAELRCIGNININENVINIINDTIYLNGTKSNSLFNKVPKNYYLAYINDTIKQQKYISNSMIKNINKISDDYVFSFDVVSSKNQLASLPLYNKQLDINLDLYDIDSNYKIPINDIFFDVNNYYHNSNFFMIRTQKNNALKNNILVEDFFIVDTNIVNQLYVKLWEKINAK